MSLGVAPWVETFPPRLAPEVILALAATAIPITSLTFFFQPRTQKFTSLTHTAIIFTMEPVFAGAAAWLWGGELFSMQQIQGGIAIVTGMLAAAQQPLLSLSSLRNSKVGAGR